MTFTFQLLLCTRSLVFWEHQGFLSPRFVSCPLDLYRVFSSEGYRAVTSTGGSSCYCKDSHALPETYTFSFLPCPQSSCDIQRKLIQKLQARVTLPYNSYGFMLAHGLAELFHLLVQRLQLLCVPLLVVSLASHLSLNIPGCPEISVL